MRKLFSVVGCILLSSSSHAMQESPEVRAWDQRQILLDQLAQNVDRILRKNSRAVRRGVDNPYVDNLIKEQIDQTNRRIKAQNAYVSALNDENKPQRLLSVTAPELSRVLDKLNPYQRDFAEHSVKNKRIMGRLLHFQSAQYEGALPQTDKAFWVDLEKLPDGPEDFVKFLTSFIKSRGAQYIAVISRKIPLPDASYSLSSDIVVEQKVNGDLFIYHHRLKNRDPNMMAAQVFTELPPAILFVRKSELFQDLKPKTQVSHLVLDTYKESAQ